MGSYGDNYGGNYDVAVVSTGSGHMHRPSIPFAALISPIKTTPRQPQIIHSVLSAQCETRVVVNSLIKAHGKSKVLVNSLLKATGECKIVDPMFKLSDLRKGKANSHGYEITARKQPTQAELEEIADIAEIYEVYEMLERDGLL